MDGVAAGANGPLSGVTIIGYAVGHRRAALAAVLNGFVVHGGIQTNRENESNGEDWAQ
jgi:hypothetical protein